MKKLGEIISSLISYIPLLAVMFFVYLCAKNCIEGNSEEYKEKKKKEEIKQQYKADSLNKALDKHIREFPYKTLVMVCDIDSTYHYKTNCKCLKAEINGMDYPGFLDDEIQKDINTYYLITLKDACDFGLQPCILCQDEEDSYIRLKKELRGLQDTPGK